MVDKGDAKFYERHPLVIIELVAAVFTFLGGIYLQTPLVYLSLKLNGPTPLVQTLGSHTGLMIFGIILIVVSLMQFYGIFKNKTNFRSMGLFANALARVYSLLGTFISQGLLPFTWGPAVVVIVTLIVCWWVLRIDTIRKNIE